MNMRTSFLSAPRVPARFFVCGFPRVMLMLAVFWSGLDPVVTCWGQTGGNPGGGGNQGGGNQGGGFPGSIVINADGIISSPVARRINPALEQKRVKALAEKVLSSDIATPSELRKVSLVRLERELRQAIDNGQEVSPSLRYLAGITQIQYLFILPETGDLVIAGPAAC